MRLERLLSGTSGDSMVVRGLVEVLLMGVDHCQMYSKRDGESDSKACASETTMKDAIKAFSHLDKGVGCMKHSID